ncbi:TetR family transcriptional regulator C-terminal domain-containing protein [Sphingosinicella humi]|uniref:TetR family transcriptional regulator n=1 Tax=Allosphingosinicella humi TaxID=2068657 RepID=A0A2U2J4G4_9SPHN|nr:TetR family transcriptional regulator C-terminal domain-containing protein [Sphingosinicella humi]PWG03207.1 TetR family transcriptional regulator [Sphingosinicella humi]
MARAAAKRESADFRRQSLIEAAADCLADKGVAGTSVRTICARAGVSPGLLRHYFEGIGDLIAATYRDVTERVSRSLAAAEGEAGPEPRQRLIAFVTASFRPPIADPKLLATWLAFWSLVNTRPAIAAIHGETYRGYREGLERLLAGCGLDPAEVRPAAIALTALVDGLWLELSLDPSTFTPAEASAIAVRWVDNWLGPLQTAC